MDCREAVGHLLPKGGGYMMRKVDYIKFLLDCMALIINIFSLIDRER